MARACPRRRLAVLLLVYLAVSLLIGWRLIRIQLVDAPQYRSLAARQSQIELVLPAQRGKLYDREGEPLAMSLTAATVYANPRQLHKARADLGAVARRLAPLLDRRPGALLRELRHDAGFVYLGRQLPREVGEAVRALELPGIGVLAESRRVYPTDRLAAQVVGFAGVDGEGLSGMEFALDSGLAGRPGAVQLQRAPGGLEISGAGRELRPSVPGSDVALTLDVQVQAATERVLAEAVTRYGAKSGSAVVLDVASGEVLAMASTTDAERAGRTTVAADRNRAVTDLFEPGSVSKVITASAALEEGLVTPEERIRIPSGHMVGGKTFSDSSEHERPALTFAEIVARSSNIGTIKVAERLGEERLHSYLTRFGYGRRPGSGFPGESAGMLAPTKDWSATSLPTISIGQGVSASLLQVSAVLGTVANGGEWVQPTLVRGTVAEDGHLQAAAPPKRRRVLSPATARTMATLLAGVVEDEHGTCPQCAVPGYRVGGKTGTAQKPSTTRRGYEAGAYVGSFVGLAPVDDPALVVGVALDEPRPVYYGGLTAGPAFADIMEFALHHRRVPPSPDGDDDAGTPMLTAASSSPA